jgi:hypothetical protein
MGSLRVIEMYATKRIKMTDSIINVLREERMPLKNPMIMNNRRLKTSTTLQTFKPINGIYIASDEK